MSSNNEIKKLAGQTAIYGSPTILARLLNYLLVPLHVYIFKPSEYGVSSELFAWTALFAVLLTYGMETAFFRFSQKEDPKKVFSTAAFSLLVTSLLFGLLCCLFAHPIANWLGYPNHSEYVIWLALILSMDALASIFFAQLRLMNRPIKFATLKMVNIGTNILFNLFFLLLCPLLLKNHIAENLISLFYSPATGIGYIFVSNLFASAITLLLFLPDLRHTPPRFDKKLWLSMFKYALPLLVLGLAGIVNETMDRILLKKLSPEDIAQSQVGIYSACYKISILMTIFIQAFKYAAEPFFFNKSKDKDSKEIYANVMRIFVLVCSVIFLSIMLYMDIVQYFVDKPYREGLRIVPILLVANLCLGIFYNLSIWYKLTDKTKFGAYIALFGASITLIFNYLLIPKIGYMGAAWTTLFCYVSMMLGSYIFGQKYYPIRYNLKKTGFYLLLALLFYFISTWLPIHNVALRLAINSVLLISYLAIIFAVDKRYLMSQLK
jgi:O-antigen/teichoic acid export membrane protein